MRKIYQWLRGDGPLWRIGVAICGMFALALAITAAVAVVGAQVLDIHGTKAEPLSATTLYDLLKIAFAVVAGIGGVIALVTAYRRQRVAEFTHDLAAAAEDRAARDSQQERDLAATRLLNERFTTAAGQFGDDKPAVQLAGVYAMAGLADDWPGQRQTCVDVLCAYLRMPYDPNPGEDAPASARQTFRALREVRHTVIRVITAHLQPDSLRAATAQDWRGLNLDFTGTVFDGGNFNMAMFSGGRISFIQAEFADTVDFSGVEFSGGVVTFYRSQFSGGTIYFGHAKFSGGVGTFDCAKFAGGTVSFDGAEFSGSEVYFASAEFSGGTVRFFAAKFSGGTVSFEQANFSGSVVEFDSATFARSVIAFYGAEFIGGTVSFEQAAFARGVVSFYGAKFSGCTVSFENVARWESPPLFPAWTVPPPGVTLPSGQASS